MPIDLKYDVKVEKKRLREDQYHMTGILESIIPIINVKLRLKGSFQCSNDIYVYYEHYNAKEVPFQGDAPSVRLAYGQ